MREEDAERLAERFECGETYRFPDPHCEIEPARFTILAKEKMYVDLLVGEEFRVHATWIVSTEHGLSTWFVVETLRGDDLELDPNLPGIPAIPLSDVLENG